MTRPKRLILAGGRGGIGSALCRYLTTHQPEIEIVSLHPFPFQYSALQSALSMGADYFVNCAALGSDSESHEKPLDYMETNVWGIARQLEMVRRYGPQCRYLSIGSVYEAAGTSPYAASKRASREIVRTYRESFGLYALQCSLGFTESFGRADGYLTRKIVKAAVRIKRALDRGEVFEPLQLRDIDQRFMWTWCDDVAEGIWLMLNQELPKEYALMSGEVPSVREFVELAFAAVGIDLGWATVSGTEQIGFREAWIDQGNGTGYGETRLLVHAITSGNALPEPVIDTRAHTDLDWHPRFTLKDIVAAMVAHELAQ